MLDTPQIETTDAELTAIIRLEVKKEKMQQVFGPSVEELISTVAEQGGEVTGPVFAHHFRMDPDVFDFAIGVPVSESIESTKRVEASELPAMKVARTVYHGPYDGLPDAWSEFHKWIEEQGFEFESDAVERYVLGPESDPDPSNWETELVRPLET